MEYIDSWLFNRGQEITLRKGPKLYYVSVQLFNRHPKHPFVHLRGGDKEKLLLRALKLIREDVAKDNQEVTYLDDYKDHDSNITPFPISVGSESDELEGWKKSPEFREAVDQIGRNIHVQELEKQWREDRD